MKNLFILFLLFAVIAPFSSAQKENARIKYGHHDIMESDMYSSRDISKMKRQLLQLDENIEKYDKLLKNWKEERIELKKAIKEKIADKIKANEKALDELKKSQVAAKKEEAKRQKIESEIAVKRQTERFNKSIERLNNQLENLKKMKEEIK